MKITFHENSLCARGTAVALFDYAYFCKRKFGFDCSVVYNGNSKANDETAINKFKNEFEVVKPYNDSQKLDNLLEELKPDAFFMEKGGPKDGIISKICKNWIHAIAPCTKNQVYGDRFAMGSRWLSKMSGNEIDFVPYMVNFPNVHEENFRSEYNIPENAVVFGRNGGCDTFDINFVKQAVADILGKRDDIYFVFQGTDIFYEHDRIIYLPTSSDLYTKVKFINTCDALIHARELGESFGATCAEFSFLNKPVITWLGSRERNHIDTLGDKGFYYNNYEEVLSLFNTFTPDPNKDWNCYKESEPDAVMEKFNEIYLKGQVA
tara:strand:- start:7815 stop:8777 length:963 start_codon:yes stop_codon:yes gene_type:complete